MNSNEDATRILKRARETFAEPKTKKVSSYIIMVFQNFHTIFQEENAFAK